MILKEIVDKLFDIASGTEYNTVSYFDPMLVAAKKRPHPSALLVRIAAPLKQSITNGYSINKADLTATLKALKKIDKDYHIEELQEPIKKLEAYLETQH